MKRRKFNRSIGLGTLSLLGTGIGCKPKSEPVKQIIKSQEPFFKLSLAQWSLNKNIKAGAIGLFDFAQKAKSMGFQGVEYVSSLYYDWLKEQENELVGLKEMSRLINQSAESTGMENLLIMIDNQGDLGIQDEAKRLEGVEMHKKWIDMAKETGCHSIRINLFGEGERQAQINASSDSMRRLGEYGKDMNVNILVENHGGMSSDPAWVVEVMKNVNMDNVGTLPDFGNFCIEREGGERWGAPCINEYPDYYKAVEMMMPYAKAVSAKSYDFDEEGNETKIDYSKMLKVVKDAGYTGFIGVEYEGETEEEGIIETRDLLIKAAQNL